MFPLFLAIIIPIVYLLASLPVMKMFIYTMNRLDGILTTKGDIKFSLGFGFLWPVVALWLIVIGLVYSIRECFKHIHFNYFMDRYSKFLVGMKYSELPQTESEARLKQENNELSEAIGEILSETLTDRTSAESEWTPPASPSPFVRRTYHFVRSTYH